MKIDLYTKAVLTVIAVALVWIGIQLTPAASAEPEIVHVNIEQIDGKAVRWASLPVKLVEK